MPTFANLYACPSRLQNLHSSRAWNVFCHIITISEDIRHNRFCMRLLMKVGATRSSVSFTRRFVIQIIIIIIIAEMAVFNVAGYLIEERRRWPVITASPRGQHSK